MIQQRFEVPGSVGKPNVMALEQRPKNIIILLRNFKQYYDLN